MDLGSLYLEDQALKEETVSMAATRVVMHQIVLPSEVDSLGICFGGQVSASPLPASPQNFNLISLYLQASRKLR